MWLKTAQLMKQEWRKDDPLVRVVNDYKEETSARSLTIDEITEYLETKKDYVVSLKIDGEMNLLHFEKSAEVISREGRIRTNFEVTEELDELLADRNRVIAIGELHVVDDDGNPVSYPDAVSVLRKPTSETQKRIRYAVFDVLEVDGEDYKEKPYWDRMEAAKRLFTGKYVYPAVVEKADTAEVKRLWKEAVEGLGYEGLVLTLGTGYANEEKIKVKPVITVDLAVLAVEPSEIHPDMMGALMLFYIDKSGGYRYAGKVGTGFKQTDRKEWFNWAQENSVKADTAIWVSPKQARVVEIRVDELRIQDTPVYTFENGEYTVSGNDKSAIGRKPVFVRIREDKQPKESDVRLEQIPGFEKESSLHSHAALSPMAAFTYHDKDYPVWSSFEGHYKPMDSDAGKFNRYAKLGKMAQEVETNLINAVKTDPDHASGRLSYACLLMMKYGIRVGNEDSAEGYESGLTDNVGEIVRTYGVTTLLPEHVEVQDELLLLNFLGKKQVEQSIKVDDIFLVETGKHYLATSKTETWLGIPLNELVVFIKHTFGSQFVPKDLRTFCANITCFDLMRSNLEQPVSEKKEAKQELKSIIENVAKQLGNTAAVTRSNYLDSRAFDWYTEKRTGMAETQVRSSELNWEEKLKEFDEHLGRLVNMQYHTTITPSIFSKEAYTFIAPYINDPDFNTAYSKVYNYFKDNSKYMKQLSLGLTAEKLSKLVAYYKKQAEVTVVVLYPEEAMGDEKGQQQIQVGDKVKLRTSAETGTVEGFASRNETGTDIDVIVKWDAPVLGEFDVSEVHPTEIEFYVDKRYGELHKEAYEPDHPEKIKITSEYYPKGISEREIYDYWKSVEAKLLPLLKDYYVMTYIQADGNVIRKRNDENGNPIKVITPEDYEKFIATGGTVEVHTVLPEEKTKLAWVDIDPKEKVLFEKTKQITSEIYEQVDELPDVKDVQVRFSGGRGFHIVMSLASPVEIDSIKASLKETLNGYISSKGDPKLTTGVTKDPEGIRLDISTLNKMGSIRAPYSLNSSTGLVDTPLTADTLASFNKETAKIVTLKKNAAMNTVPDKYKGSFVIQKHLADKAGLHYDFRLEFPASDNLEEYEGKRTKETPEPRGVKEKTVLRSWAIRKLDDLLDGKKDKVLAVSVEDHPIEYAKFEGEIPEGYGKGTVGIFDNGTFEMISSSPDKYKFKLNGKNIQGSFTLIHTNKNQWLLLKSAGGQ